MAITCSFCGTEIKGNETACSLCGTAVENTSTPVVETPAPIMEEIKPEPTAEAENIVTIEEVKGETDAAPVWICTQCGKEFDSATKFCGECGGKVTEKKPVEEIVSVWICTQCGKEFDSATKFCCECGGKVTEKKPVEEIVPVWICTKCGKEFDSATKFCGECGGKVLEKGAEVPEEVSEAAEEPVQSENLLYDIYLIDTGNNKVGVIKEIRAVTGVGLADAKRLAEGTPVYLKRGCLKEEAEMIKEQLTKAGAEVKIIEAGKNVPGTTAKSSKKNQKAAETKDSCQELVKKYKKFLKSLHDDSWFYVNKMNTQKLDSALESYGSKLVKSKDDIIIHHDSTAWGGAREGFILTPYGIAYKALGNEPKIIHFSSSTTCTVQDRKDEGCWTISFKGNKKNDFGWSFCYEDNKRRPQDQKLVDVILEIVDSYKN